MLLLPRILEQYSSKFLCKSGIRDNIKYYKENEICQLLTCNVCIALPFLHAFAGCNTTSSFSNYRKLKLFDTWIKHHQNDYVRKVLAFKELSNETVIHK